MMVLNTGEYTRHNETHNSFSAIDFTISNSALAPKIGWEILTDYNTSDHWPIFINILNQSPKIHSFLRWCIKNPNWELYSNNIKHNLGVNPFNLDLVTY